MGTQAAAHPYLDNFTIGLVCIVALLTSVDWLLGPVLRDRLQRRVGDWWVFVEENRFGEYISYQAGILNKFYREYFVDVDRFSWWSSRFQFVLFPGIVFMAVGTFSWIYVHGLGQPISKDQTGSSTHVLLPTILLVFFVGIFGLKIFGTLVSFLQKTSSGASVYISVFATILYLAFAIFCIYTCIFLSNIYDLYVRPLYQSNIVAPKESIDTIVGIGPLRFPYRDSFLVSRTSGAMAVGALLPSALLLAGSQFFFGFSKVFSSIVKPVTSFFLQRFYESDKGILTTIAVFGGALGKLTQEVVKYLGN